MIVGFIFILLIFSIIPIAFIEYVLLKKFVMCEKCGYKLEWYRFVMPCTLETLLFLAGVAIGMNL